MHLAALIEFNQSPDYCTHIAESINEIVAIHNVACFNHDYISVQNQVRYTMGDRVNFKHAIQCNGHSLHIYGTVSSKIGLVGL